MTIKEKIANSLVDEHKISKSRAAKIVNSVFETLVEQIDHGGRTRPNVNRVAISGLGVFKVKMRQARQGINPQTRTKITIPAHKVVSFTPAATLKERINKN